MRSGTITECGETITVQGETVSCKQNPNPLPRVRWGNLGLNWAFFEKNRVSSQNRWKY